MSLALKTPFDREVAGRFGLVPNFFASAPDAPEIIEKLWDFAKSGYLDNPIPSLFKERLFVYLSRFCAARYCVVRHCAFLVGHGHSSGDPSAPPQSVDQAIRLLRTEPPWLRNSDSVLQALETGPSAADWPDPESEFEDQLFVAATLVFVDPTQSGGARKALRRALGGRRFEYLMGLLAFIRTAHYWTVIHPDLQHEDDALALLSANEELAGLLLQDPEAGRSDLSARLLAELEDLRGLNERRELEKAKRALEVQLEQKDLLLKEMNHRVKNSLQIVSSILHLQTPQNTPALAADILRSAAARVQAIAAVHERLYVGDDVRVVSLHSFLSDICREIARAFDRPDSLQMDFVPVEVPTDMAVPFALIVNELVTNALKHAGPPCLVVMRKGPGNVLKLSVSDTGSGPSDNDAEPGLGSRMVEAFVGQLGGSIDRIYRPNSYAVEVTLPVPPKP
jgi:two-component sensor histidine kinase